MVYQTGDWEGLEGFYTDVGRPRFERQQDVDREYFRVATYDMYNRIFLLNVISVIF